MKMFDIEHNTVTHLIFRELKYRDFERLTYWHSFSLTVSQFNAL